MKNDSPYVSKLYGRKKSRSLNAHSQYILKNLFPKYKLEDKSIIANGNNIEFEIGFGYGEHLLWQALNNKNKMFIGAEPFISGAINLIKEVNQKQIKNIRISTDDAINIVDTMADCYLSSIYILFPDPWPKRRHHKRRLINPNNIDKFHRVLKKNGKLLIASDHKGYIHSILLDFLHDNRFDWICERSSDFTEKPFPSTQSKYEKKAIKNDQNPVYLTFKKISL
ncbi:MAG: tRNA (guanosine(46)-N7)-methyltransferase TrmB [Rhodobiaceae bacterium]|nr:tRNA (guanosine(46)-N7)-methyltransferase TrmB [Rhodobiaceae bacterium]